MRINLFEAMKLSGPDEALSKLEALLMRHKLTMREVAQITELSFILGNCALLERLIELGYEDVAEEIALSVVDLTKSEN